MLDNPPEPPAIPSTEIPREEAGSRLFSVCFATVALIAGILLVVFPWSDGWNANYAPRLVPSLREVWNDPYFRGAVAGLGFVNIYLACLEVARLRRTP